MTIKTILGVTLAVVFALSMTAGNAFAASGGPMHVISGEVSSNNIVLTTAAKAGVAVPDEEDTIFAYVAFTDTGIYAATSHFGTDNPPVNSGDLEWHTHKVTLNENGCVTELQTVGDVSFSGKSVIISGTDATEVDAAAGVMLKISDAGVCVKKAF